EPLIAEPWILDVDTTIKPLYGHQEGAVLGYNPKKPGRPSHSLLSHLFDGLDASCSRCRRLSRRRTYLQARRAELVGSARSPAARPHVRRCCAATAVSAPRGSCARPRRADLPSCSSCA